MSTKVVVNTGKSFTGLRPAMYRSEIQKVERGSTAGSAFSLLSWWF